MRQFLLTATLCCIFVMSAFQFLLAQDAAISGRVTDNDGLPLPGVSVIIKDSQQGTLTDLNGKYSIQAATDAVLVFTFLGMEKQEIAVQNLKVIDVVLRPSATSLNEVVVVGYGTAQRANLTSAQTSISAKDLNRTVNTTLEQAIQGRSAGVYITQNSGQPGGGISVNIRGVNSINGSNEPLYVIDGVQMQPDRVNFGTVSSSNGLAGLNPDDIEDVQILQGPSATSIYGSRATNGVVLITTKRGKGGDVKITYGYQRGIQTAPQRLTVMDLRQYAQMVNEFHAIAGGETPLEFLDPSLLGAGTDWQKELFSNAAMDKHQLNLSGGSENTTYYLSGDYLNQEGVAAGSGFKRYAVRLNLDNKPKKWATIAVNLSFNQTNEKLTTSQENIISNALQLTPQIPVKNLDGSWGGGDDNNGANIFAPVNPVAIANLTTNTNKRRQFLGGIDLGIQIFKDLKFKTAFNTNIGYANNLYYIPTYKIGWAENVAASLQDGANLNTYWNFNQQLDYSKQFDKHNINLTAVHEAQESLWKNLRAGRTGFLTNDILDLAAGDELTASNSGGSGDWAMESYLGRINYNFDSRYLFTGTFRADASANFGAENKWGIFPSASLAWRISEEEFFKVPMISELKIRLETGTTGNQGSNGYIYSPMRAGATPTGTGFLPSRYSNPGLKWESTKTDNIGLNIGLFKNRIEIEADYYIKNTDNLLLTNPLPWYMGSIGQGAIEAPMVNIGALQNKGWGITINTINIDKEDFRWSSNLNISGFKTTIKKFYSETAIIDRTSWWLNDWTQRSAVGQAPWLFRGYIEEGIFQSLDEINSSPVPVDNNGVRLPTDFNNGIWVGDVKYKDVSGPEGKPDGVIDVNDLTTIGNPWPKMFGGFTNSFSYKGFDLSILITGTFGNDVYNYLARVNSNPNNINLSRNLLIEAMDYARPVTADDGSVSLENPETNVARISYGPNGNYARITDKWVQDGSFIRLKNVSLNYTIPAKLIAKQSLVRNARIGFSAQNVATITGYKGFDPEVGAYVGRDAGADNQAIGLDFGRYPLTPIYTFSLGIDF
jgi:TonB-linked SusC/RagA family outer membrane protein